MRMVRKEKHRICLTICGVMAVLTIHMSQGLHLKLLRLRQGWKLAL